MVKGRIYTRKYGSKGEGGHPSSIGGVHTHAYRVWNDMMNRCNAIKKKRKQETYAGCTVCVEWMNFQNFAEWYNKNYYEIDGCMMCLDKDILVKGNKVYSPETCCFVPQHINNLFVKGNAIRGNYPIGVGYHKNSKKFRAYIKMGTGKAKHIGYFNDVESAFKAYKEHKENYIKEIAEKYKGYLPNKVYCALLNYKVEITD